MTDREASRLLTRCEQLEREIEEMRTEIKRLKDERPIQIGDMVEVFQATVNPWTDPEEIGTRWRVTGFASEIGWRDNGRCIDVDIVETDDNAFALCDVRKVC